MLSKARCFSSLGQCLTHGFHHGEELAAGYIS